MPRARLVANALTTSAPEKDIGKIDIDSTALVSETVRLEGGPPGTAFIEADQPGRIRLKTRTTTQQLLVVSESWHEGWRLTLDGQTRPVVRVYGEFIGGVVDSGEHEVEFRFRPQSLRLGAWLSIVGFAGLLLARIGSRAPTVSREQQHRVSDI
jgi:hypothetical protein